MKNFKVELVKNYDFLFVKPAIICEISNKICKNNGRCTDCPTG